MTSMRMSKWFQFGGKRVIDVDSHEKHKREPMKHEVSLVCVVARSSAPVVPILTMLRS